MALIKVDDQTVLKVFIVVKIGEQGIFFAYKVDALNVWNKPFTIDEAAIETIESDPRPFWACKVDNESREWMS